MFPWFWFFAPQVHFPWSGSVAQQIEPNLGWFFGAIRPDAGNGTLEREAFDVATYGRQIGLLTEAVLGGTGASRVTHEEAAQALERLEEIRLAIEALKQNQQLAKVEALSRQLDTLRVDHPEAFRQLSQKFLPPPTHG